MFLLAFLFPGASLAANRKGAKRVGGVGPHGKGGHYEGGVNTRPGAKAPRKSRAKTPASPPAPKPPAAPDPMRQGG